jgi:hypothetical protein
MKKYIGCDAHASYLVFVSVGERGQAAPPIRVEHGGRLRCSTGESIESQAQDRRPE